MLGVVLWGPAQAKTGRGLNMKKCSKHDAVSRGLCLLEVAQGIKA